MGFRFQKRIRIAPGVTLNLSKSGGSLSIGPRGAKINIGMDGVRTTFGIPGSGISYSKKLGSKSKSGKQSKADQEPGELNFFQRMMTADDEEALLDAFKAFNQGDHVAALSHAKQAATLADGAFLAGILALEAGQLDMAAQYFQRAMDQQSELNQHFARYDLSALMTLDITETVQAHIEPDARGVALALAEVHQAQGRTADAIHWLRWLSQQIPDDVVVRLSLAELIDESDPSSQAAQEIMRLAEGITNETPLHTALLYYRAKALGRLGMLEPAAQTLTDAMRRKKDRSPELLLALRYERGLIYEAMGQAAKARKDFEAVFAESPTYADVATRLGIK